MAPNLLQIHKEDGQTGHFGEFFILIGSGILLGALLLLIWGLNAQTGNTGVALRGDTVTAAAIYGVLGLGCAMFGVTAIYSGWGRKHPGFDDHSEKERAHVED